MKLVKLTSADAQYFLNSTELMVLRSLLRKFPFTPRFPARVTRRRGDPQTAERKKLLNQALAEHRRQLKASARNLLADEKIHSQDNGHLLTLTSEDRETLLQVLNDIRVGCWHALGKPEAPQPHTAALSNQEIKWHGLMHFTAHFEAYLVEDGEAEEKADA